MMRKGKKKLIYDLIGTDHFEAPGEAANSVPLFFPYVLVWLIAYLELCITNDFWLIAFLDFCIENYFFLVFISDIISGPSLSTNHTCC